MDITVLKLLVVAAFVCTILAASWPAKVPFWVPLFLVIVVQAIQVFPVK